MDFDMDFGYFLKNLSGDMIVTIVAILVFLLLLWQLNRVLGKNIGYNGDGHKKLDKKSVEKTAVIKKIDPEINLNPEKQKLVQQEQHAKEIDYLIKENHDLNAKLKNILNQESSFSLKKFLSCAQVAYEDIMNAYVKGDKSILKLLLTSSLYGEFEDAIDQRQRRGDKINYSFIGVEKCDVIFARLDNNTAQISVLFITQSSSATYDNNGVLIKGDPNKVSYHKDIWIFQKLLGTGEKTWLLAQTEQQ